MRYPGCMLSRRHFLQRGVLTIGAMTGLDAFLRTGWAGEPPMGMGFGPLQPDPEGIFDLPKGFSYRVISRAGARTAMGYLIPGCFDGMGAFAATDADLGCVVLVRNHELSPDQTMLGPFRDQKPEPNMCYDNGANVSPSLGGTTTVVYDPATGATKREYVSLAGTTRNCGGGTTPWGTWITCEETTESAGPNKGSLRGYINNKDHGFAFEVQASAKGLLSSPQPLTAMGRFRREAVAVNPNSGLVYQTEDQKDGVFYRFIPARPGKLAEGGRLQALRLRDFTGDTTNWERQDIAVGQSWGVDWIEIKDPLNDPASQARLAGAHRFTRAEGITLAKDRLWFTTTDGGAARKGQIWELDLRNRANRLTLFCEPNDATLLENSDNLAVAPWGGLVACEDAVGDDVLPGQYLIGITPTGQPYQLGCNRLNRSELAGVCFAPDGKTMFVNIYDPGLTLAITGPWVK